MDRILRCILILLAVPLSCSSPRNTAAKTEPSVQNLSNMYNPTNTRIHPAYSIYHNSPGSSLLFVKLFPAELLYSGTIEPNKLLGQISIDYILRDITDVQKPELADSGRMLQTFSRENADKRFQAQIPLKTQTGRSYQLSITITDLVRRAECLTYLYVDRTMPQSEQNFMLIGAEDKGPFYKPYVIANSTLKIEYNNQEEDTVYVKYYSKEIPLPRPTFSMNKEKEFFNKPDSIWVLPFSKMLFYQFNYEGVYYFQPDTNKEGGLTLMNFGEKYPRVQEISQLIDPLVYLANSIEFAQLKKATNQKLAVDNFWLEKAGNIEKARELIRVYYNRVYFANYYFTSYKPGWKTDRGMIFIIFGPPQSVKVSPTQEKWIYYKNNFTTTVTFTFDHNPAPFSPDIYTLQRSDSYDTFWRSAVDTWRKGNIYMIE
jgi:GWxTD domain-containing protein